MVEPSMTRKGFDARLVDEDNGDDVGEEGMEVGDGVGTDEGDGLGITVGAPEGKSVMPTGIGGKVGDGDGLAVGKCVLGTLVG